MAEHGVAALSHVPSGERVRTGPADPSGAWDQEHPPSMETTTQESGLRENRTSRLSERTEEGRKPDLLRLYIILHSQSRLKAVDNVLAHGQAHAPCCNMGGIATSDLCWISDGLRACRKVL